jgi:hypothetical protein
MGRVRVPDSLGALRERNFRLFFAGQAASSVGDDMVPVALAFVLGGREVGARRRARRRWSDVRVSAA